MAEACFLARMLTVVQLQDCLTKSQRTWVRGRLQYLSEALGVKIATTMPEEFPFVMAWPRLPFHIFLLLSLLLRPPKAGRPSSLPKS